MSDNELISAFADLGNILKDFLSGSGEQNQSIKLNNAINLAAASNPWFVEPFIRTSLSNIANILEHNNLKNWLKSYDFNYLKPKKIALIMAGNIPLVGFHDLLSVVLSGNIAKVKMSSKDMVLLPVIRDLLLEINPKLDNRILLELELVKDFDAVIATGSNNSGRYFDYYFGKYPSIIRRNRNSVAIIHPSDNSDVFQAIGQDVFYYFGLGCRSVSKLYLPRTFNPVAILDALNEYVFISDNYKYFNNYEYNKSICLINRIKHFDNGFMIFKEDLNLASPVSVVNFEFYDDEIQLKQELQFIDHQIQCIVSSEWKGINVVKPGNTQFPNLTDWADNIDVLRFLKELDNLKIEKVLN